MSFFEQLVTNPCALAGVSLEEGAENIVAALVVFKSTRVIMLIFYWIYLALQYAHGDRGVHILGTPVYNQAITQLYDQVMWDYSDAMFGMIADVFLLQGVWNKNKEYIMYWLLTFGMRGFRYVLIEAVMKPYYWRDFVLGLHVYWVIIVYLIYLDAEDQRLGNPNQEPPLPATLFFLTAGFFEMMLLGLRPVRLSYDAIFADVNFHGPRAVAEDIIPF